MSRIIAIDYGEKRVGIALSDPLRILSKPYMVLHNNDKLIAKIQNIIAEKQASSLVLGIPYNLEGKESMKTKEVLDFGEILKKSVQIPVIYQDERFTTVVANAELKKMGYDIKESRKVVDKIAASIILRDYLETLEK